ncbi:CGNR zinc finger domain-containing protein [Streptomyces sp. NPDC060194]|uniref:CGNR zinc finger domain-containing protein n=1 Tax=Streptomyces sp. NPDC060194 TaxID=3347069 RepID=UPI00364D9E08
MDREDAQPLALALASTIRHDGAGGVADDLADVAGLREWMGEQDELGAPDATEELRAEVVRIREAVRALFARAVSPAPPSPADAHRLLPVGEALARLNAAAAPEPVVPELSWPADGTPSVHLSAVHPGTDPGVRLVAQLARAAADFLAGPQRARLRACTAPRCVRYYVQTHGRQEWCRASCGNRARVARHARRQRERTAGGQAGTGGGQAGAGGKGIAASGGRTTSSS